MSLSRSLGLLRDIISTCERGTRSAPTGDESVHSMMNSQRCWTDPESPSVIFEFADGQLSAVTLLVGSNKVWLLISNLSGTNEARLRGQGKLAV